MSKLSLHLKNSILAEALMPHGAEYYLIHSLFLDSESKSAVNEQRFSSKIQHSDEQNQIKECHVAEKVEQLDSIRQRYIGSNTLASEIRKMLRNDMSKDRNLSDKDRIKNASPAEIQTILREIAIKKLNQKKL